MPTQAEVTPLNRNERIYRAAPVEKYRGRPGSRATGRPWTGVYRDYIPIRYMYTLL